MPPRARRFPFRDVLLLIALLAVAGLLSWSSGRVMVLSEMLSPFLRGIQAVTSTWNQSAERVQAIRTMESDNEALTRRVDELEKALREREEQALENDRLHALLALPLPHEAQPLLVARVIARSPDNWHQRLVLDKGSEEGLEPNAVVINRQGLIGKVVALGAHTSLVSLLNDLGTSVSVLNVRTRSSGVLQGQGDAWPVLRYMEQPEKWRVGDRVITSGLGGVFPKGLPVGRIVQLKTSKETLYPELRLEPGVEMTRLEEVVLMPAGILAMPTPSPKPSPSPTPRKSP